MQIIEADKQMTETLYSNKGASLKLKPDDFEFVMPLGRGAFGEVVLVHQRSVLPTKGDE